LRSITSSSCNFEKSSSKIEDVVKNLKETETKKKAVENVDASVESISTNQQQLVVSKVESSVAVKKTLMQRIWAELVHYYHGFRLLFIDINVSRKLLWKIMNGDSLSRRENRLLVRTTSGKIYLNFKNKCIDHICIFFFRSLPSGAVFSFHNCSIHGVAVASSN
jgi:LETM1 and EF-hand domain-containing protein 1, mitochondrial